MSGTMRWSVTSLAVTSVAALTIWIGSLPAAVAQPGAAPGVDRLQQLRVERRDTLAEMLRGRQAAFSKGMESSDKVCQAAVELNEAELELCRTRDERLKVLEHLVAFLRQHEQREEARVKSGQSVEADHLNAKVRRLKAEIELEKVRAKP